MQPPNEYASIPRGVQPSLIDDLSMLFTNYFVQEVKNSVNYQSMGMVDWWGARCQLLQSFYQVDMFPTDMDKRTRDIVTAWGWAYRCPYIMSFLHQLVITPLFMRVCEVLCAHGIFAVFSPTNFIEALMQTWFGLRDWMAVPPGMYIQCGFQHVYIGELDRYVVHGLHYWGTYYLGEQQDQIIFDRTLNKHPIFPMASIRFHWNGAVKPQGTIFFGCPTEFESLIFFCAFLLGGNQRTSFLIDGNLVHVRCIDHTTNRSRELVTAFFEF